MQHGSPLALKVEHAITDVLTHVGYELILVEFLPKSRLLRLYIDFPYTPSAHQSHDDGVSTSADAGADDRTITLDDCTKVSRLVSDVLDGEGIMETGEGAESGDGYRLEVSSPGLDRPLVKPAHFQRFTGLPVRLRTRTKLADSLERKFEATLVTADADGIVVAVSDTELHIPYANLDKAQLVPTF